MEERKVNVIPLAGFSFIKMETLLGANTGTIVLPESLKGRPVYIGKVVKSTFSDRDRAHLGVDSIDGCRVLVANNIGRHIEGNTYAFPNLYARDPRAKVKKFDTPYLAIIPPEFSFDLQGIGTEEVPRCRFCGPSKSDVSQNNVFMQHNRTHGWYCVRCNRTQDGTKIDPLAVEVKDGYAPELYPENRRQWTQKLKGTRVS
jgi:hypothetical protein